MMHASVKKAKFEMVQDTVLPLGGGEDGKSPLFVVKDQIVQYSIMAVHRRKDLLLEYI